MKSLFVLALLFGSAASFAQTPSQAPATPPGAAPQGQSMPVPEMPPQGAPPVGQTFEERKAKALDEIDRHIADLRKLEACIQATTNPDQMRSCRPPHEPGHRRPVN